MNRRDVSAARTAQEPPSEPPGWLDGLTLSLIRRAAGKAPAALSARLEEEWLADLAARHGRAARLRFAIGCCWATRVIAREFSPARVAATAAAGARALALESPPQAPLFTRRTVVLILIVSLHLAVIYFLTTAAMRHLVKPVPTSTVARFLPDPQSHPPPPSAPQPPRFTLSRIEIPEPPPVRIDVPRDTIIHDVAPALPPTPPTPVREMTRVQGGPGPGFPNTDDYYPSASIRLGEKGIALVQVCVDAGGRLTAAPLIAQSSASARLDQGALLLARAASGRYRPTTENGRPVSSCYPFRIRFELRN